MASKLPIEKDCAGIHQKPEQGQLVLGSGVFDLRHSSFEM